LVGTVLREAGVTADAFAAQFLVSRKEGVPETAPYTPGVRRVLTIAADEARALGHDDVGVGHLLLGGTGVGDGLAVRMLQTLHVDRDELRTRVRRALAGDETPRSRT